MDAAFPIQIKIYLSIYLSIGQLVLENEYINLKLVFQSNFDLKNYNPHHARRRVLQMPLACLTIEYGPGNTECILVKYNQSVDYTSYARYINKSRCQYLLLRICIKKMLKSLLQLCESDREREILRYAVVKSSGLSLTKARKSFGYDNASRRMSHVENAVKHTQSIYQAMEKLARTKARESYFEIIWI